MLNKFYQATILFLLLMVTSASWAQNWQWVATQSLTSTGSFLVNGTAIDASGNIIVAGQFSGTITLGNLTLTSSGSGDSDIFIAKLSSTGTWIQATRAGGPGIDLVYSLAVDGGGNAIITGPFRGPTVTFGAITLANANSSGTTDDLFVARLSPAGTWIQAVQAGGVGSDLPSKIAVDAVGNATVIGTVGAPSAQFGASLLTSGPGLFVARLSATGNWTHVAKTGNASGDLVYGLSLANNGDAWITGAFSSPNISFGATVLTNTDPTGATSDAFIARLTAAGIWGQSIGFGGTASEVGAAIHADIAGNVTIAGSFRSPSLSFGSNRLTNAGATSGTADIFVAQYTNAGLWARAAQAGGPGSDGPSALEVDGSGNVFVAGSFRGPAAGFGPFSLVNNDASGATTDIFVASLNNNYNWTQAIQASGNSLTYNDACTSLALTGNGEAVAGGRFNGTAATFGSLTFSHPNGSGYVARLGGLALAAKPAAIAVLALIPNPAHSAVNFTLEADHSSRSITILNSLGRPVRTFPLPAHATTATLDLAGLAPGLYVVRCGAASARLVVE
ncbi:hypothetical protein GCM10028822_13910 [Hymenobacter terrigena]